MIDIHKYIGIPYKSKGYDFDGADCYGLVHLFLKNEFGLILPLFKEYDYNEDPIEVERQMSLNIPLLIGKETNTPLFGDIALLKFRGTASHMGIYIANGKVLHILRGSDSALESVDGHRLKGRLEGYYELEEKNKTKCGSKSV